MSVTIKAPIAPGLMLCGLLAACGDSVPTTPGAPATASPKPTSSPAVTSAGYLHVLQHPWVMTYEIDPTGRLRPPVTQPVRGGLVALAGEPQGRFVYGAHGGWSTNWRAVGGVGGSDLTIVTYAPDPRDGTLAELSEATVVPRPTEPPCTACSSLYSSAWTWLKGGANRVHGLWDYRWGTAGRHSTYAYVSLAVDSDGHLGPVRQTQFQSDSDYGYVLVDVRSDVLYKGGESEPYGRGGLEAHVIEPDGTLNRMGWTNLCLANTMSEYSPGFPLVAARGFVFASAYEPYDDYRSFPSVCSYQGLRLKPLYALDLQGAAADAFVPSSEAEPALLAMQVWIWTGRYTRRSELRLFSMNADGDLQPLASEDLAQRGITQLLFHPSRRFLYTVDSASQLRAYAIDSSGRLEQTMSIDKAGGSMAITLKDPRAEDR